MPAWLESIRKLLSDDIFEGLSFILALLMLIIPFFLRKFKYEKAKLSGYFWWTALPLLAVFTMLSAYWQNFEWVCVFNGILILLHFIRQYEVSQLMNGLEDTKRRLEESKWELRESKRMLDQCLRSTSRRPGIIKPK
jgi:hypothetical protein